MAYDMVDRLRAERARKAEKDRKRLLGRVMDALDMVAEKYRPRRVFLFGSLVKVGRFRDDSDIDVAVVGLDSEALQGFCRDMEHALERDVEAVSLANVHFRSRIEKGGIEWTSKE